MMSGYIGFMDLRQRQDQYCCLRSIKLYVVLITVPYLYNIALYIVIHLTVQTTV